MEPPPRAGYRDRHRARRRREFLDTAKRIINTESQDALTMQRLVDEVGASVGGVYVYFASRDALLAELQREAFQMLLASYRLGQQHLDEALATRDVSPPEAALTKLLANGVFWVDSEETMPSEIELSRRLIAGQEATPVDPSAGVLPIALELLDEGRQRLDAAVEAGVLDPGNNIERAIMLISSTTGVLLVGKLGDWDHSLFDGRRLAGQLTADILVGWGATRARLGVAEEHLQAFRAEGTIAPHVDPPE